MNQRTHRRTAGPTGRTIPTLLCALLTLAAAGTAAGDAGQTYTVDALVFSTPADIPWLQEGALADLQQNPAALIERLLPGDQAAQASPAEVRRRVQELGATVLSAPRINLPPGSQANVISQARIQYFTPGEDGCYQLQEPEPGEPGVIPGVSLELQLQELPDGPGRRVRLSYTARVTVLTGREPLPGVILDVGPPILHTQAAQTTLEVLCGRWFLASVSQLEKVASQGADLVFVLARVLPAE
jgi:hypothetical protein